MGTDKNNELNVDERRSKIIEILNRDGKVKVAELSRIFSISEVTIRNDLSGLEATGALERIHGGALVTGRAYYNMSLHERMKTNEEEKRRIGKLTASMISDGDTVFINSGTTTLYAVQEMKNIKNLTIVTNSLAIAQDAGCQKNINIILLGGNLNAQYQFTYGDDTVQQLRKYKADKLILSVDGVNSEDGITTYHHQEAEVNRQMIARVNKTLIVADFSKIGRISFAHIDSIDSTDILISNINASQEEITAIREKGVEVQLT